MIDEKVALYIHIPFCISKCSYCDFLSFGGSQAMERQAYIEALIGEIESIAAVNEQAISTIYIGGGTPSILTAEQFDQIMMAVHSHFDTSECVEFTVEMNPGTVTKEKLASYVKMGVNRVSMGLQSDDDEMLKTLGRIHSYEGFITTYVMIKEAGIENISIDLMFALPDQSMNDLQVTLDKVIALKPNHISAYSLIIEEDTKFEELYDQGLLNLPNEDVEREMFWMCHDQLKAAGYHHYEISNYALKGQEAIHNSSYWTLAPYYGLGLGASSYIDHKRYKNTVDLQYYIDQSRDVDKIRSLESENGLQQDLEESLFLGLRKLDGIDLDILYARYGSEAMNVYQEIFIRLIEDKLMVKKGSVLKLTNRGIDLSNQVFEQLILD